MASRPVTLPPGFVLEEQAEPVNLPPGFVLEAQPEQPAPEEQPGMIERFRSSFGAAVGAPERAGDILEGPAFAIRNPIESVKLLYEGATEAQQELVDRAFLEQRQGNLSRGLALGVYSALPLVGPALARAGEQFEEGDVAGGIGTTTGVAAGALLAPEARASAAAGVRGAGRAVLRAPGAVKRAPTALLDASREAFTRTRAIRTIPEAKNLPTKAIMGVEDIFRASAPTGGNPQFRGNLYAAAGDLAEVGQKLNLAESKGGVINPDMRPRATVKAINEHLKEMYKTEREPQITRNAQNPVQLELNADAQAGLKHVQRVGAGESNRSLAQRASQQDTITLAEVDELARVVNRELVDLNAMTPSERALKLGTNRRLSDLKALDRQLKTKINSELEARGEVGVTPYERRFAGLSAVRDQLQTRINAVELGRKIPGVGLVRSVLGGKAGIASASQAAVADVNIGRMLENGFRALSESGITPNRGVAVPKPTVRGLLTEGAPQLPASSLEAPLSAPPPLALGTRASRKGLLLPERTAIDLPERTGLEPLEAGSTGSLPAASILVRGKDGRLRRMFLTSERTLGEGEQIVWVERPKR